MKKIKNKKTIIIMSIILLFIFLTLILLVNIKKLRATANNDMLGFKDKNLYNCVLISHLENVFENLESEADMITLYNKIIDNYENFPVKGFYDVNLFGYLTEEEMATLINSFDITISNENLKEITDLTCTNVKDYAGIENLESLEYLSIEGNVEKLDLSNNKKLKTFHLDSEEKSFAKKLKLPESLEHLYIRNYEVTDSIIYDDNLNNVTIKGSSFENLSFSENTPLTDINIQDSNFGNIDLSRAKKLTLITIYANANDIKLPEEMTNTSITINGDIKTMTAPNKATNISIFLTSNMINSLDLSGVDSFSFISFNTSNLKELSFKENSSIRNFHISASNIETLDFSKINVDTFNSMNGVKKLKFKESIPKQMPSYLDELSLEDGSYIKLMSEKVEFINDILVFKDKEITVGDIINSNNVIEKSGFEFKICSTSNCSNINGSSEFSNETTLQTIPGKYINIYKNSSIIKSYQLDVMDNEYFEDYVLYKAVLSSSKLADYTANNLTEAQLNSITGLSMYSLGNVKSYKGFEKLTGLKSLYMSKDLSMAGVADIPNNIFDSFSQLEILNMHNINIDTLDISSLPNLKDLTIHYSNINNLIANNNPMLEIITASHNNIKNIILFEDNSNNVVKQISLYNSDITNLNVSNLHSLNSLFVNDNDIKQLDVSKNTELINLDVSKNKLESLNIDNNVNLKELNIENNNISYLNLKNNKKLEIIYMDNNMLEEVDFSNNSNLKHLGFLKNQKIKKIKGVFNIPPNYDDFWVFPELEEIDLTNCGKLEMLILASNKLKTIDISDCSGLGMLFISSPILEEIKGIDGATNLFSLLVPYSNIKTLDLSKAASLQALNIQFSSISKKNINLLVGESRDVDLSIKLPNHIVFEHYNEDDYFAEYDQENNLVVANNPGQTVISSYVPTLHFSLNEITKSSLKTYVNVFDIKSSKFLVNKEYKYIFNENNEENKVLNRYIKVHGEDVSKKIEDNKLHMYSGDKKIFTFDILELTSKDYKIDNTKNVITYSGTFDISKLNVVNGTLNKIDDEIQLICNDNIVKTYKLEEK